MRSIFCSATNATEPMKFTPSIKKTILDRISLKSLYVAKCEFEFSKLLLSNFSKNQNLHNRLNSYTHCTTSSNLMRNSMIYIHFCPLEAVVVRRNL